MGASLLRPLNGLAGPFESFNRPSAPLENRYHRFEDRVIQLHHQLAEVQQQYHIENRTSDRSPKRNYTGLNVLPAGAVIHDAQVGPGSTDLLGDFSCKALCRVVEMHNFAP